MGVIVTIVIIIALMVLGVALLAYGNRKGGGPINGGLADRPIVDYHHVDE